MTCEILPFLIERRDVAISRRIDLRVGGAMGGSEGTPSVTKKYNSMHVPT